MAKMSVPQAAADLGVSAARVRQRIEEGSLVAEKIGGRWLVDLAAHGEIGRPARGRPVSPSSVWYSLLAVGRGALLDVPSDEVGGSAREIAVRAAAVSPASRHRAVARLRSAIQAGNHDEIVAWLRHRGERRLYLAAEADLPAIRDDERLLLSGLSDPDSGMSDPRVAEGYIASTDADQFAEDHWLESPSLDDRPNVVLHVVPALPPRISRLLLAADLAEHSHARELKRAHELLDDVIAEHGETQ